MDTKSMTPTRLRHRLLPAIGIGLPVVVALVTIGMLIKEMTR